MREKNRKRTQVEDDGRTIVNMNVEGMPWYHRSVHQDSALLSDAAGSSAEDGADGRSMVHDEMTAEQMRMYRWAAVKAGLLAALVFGGVFALFIAFCDFIWFR